MGGKVQELLEMLHTMITEAWGVPLGAEKCVIERDKVLDLLSEIRAHFPQEIAEAKRLVDARTEIISNAKREADAMRKAAEEHARHLIDEQEVLRTARAKSNEMLAAAESTSAELRRVTNEYIDEAMKRSEESLTAAFEQIRDTRMKFKNAARAISTMPAMRQPVAEQELDDM